jgi:hypothetical protein
VFEGFKNCGEIAFRCIEQHLYPFYKFPNQRDIALIMAFEKWWICFFALSAAAFTVYFLKDFFDLPASNAGRDL